jgi:hypothetical protein
MLLISSAGGKIGRSQKSSQQIFAVDDRGEPRSWRGAQCAFQGNVPFGLLRKKAQERFTEFTSMRALYSFFFAGFAALSLVAASGCSADSEEATSGDQGELKNGSYSDTTKYTAFVTIGSTTCSAVRISDRLIATAAHCVLDGSGSLVAGAWDRGSIQIAVGAPQFARVANVVTTWVDGGFSGAQEAKNRGPTDYDTSMSLDLAVIELQTNPFHAMEWPIAQLASLPTTSALQVTGCGQGSTIAGVRTCTSMVASAMTPLETTQRFGIDAKRDINRIYWKQTAQWGVTHGDSGGGVFQDGKLVGLVSGGIALPALYGSEKDEFGFATRLAAQPNLAAAIRADSVRALK